MLSTPRFLFTSSLILMVAATGILFAPARCGAELLPPGDFNGISLDQWGLDYLQWSIATGLGGQTLPDTVNGARYLPPNFGGGNFTADLSITPDLGLIATPFVLFGEQYDDGTADDPNDPFIDTIFMDAMIRSTLDGVVVLEGTGSSLSDRMFGMTVFPAPIPYAMPIPRGDKDAIAAVFGGGITTIFANLSPGSHTIVNEFNSMYFGAASFTYNVTVVPEPAGLASAGMGVLCLAAFRRRMARRRTA